MPIRNGHDDNDTLFRRARSATWKRVLVGLFAVPAVLIGLFAMHVLAASGDPAGQHVSMSVTSATAQVTDATPASTAARGCGEFCGPNHDMGAMTCMLAVLLTELTLAALVAFSGWVSAGAALTALGRVVARPQGLAPPLPPSLSLLSISRI